MSDKIIDIETWLNTPPADEEVFSLNADGTGKYIPYDIVVGKLYQLCGHNWSDYNLHVTYINLPDRRTMVSGTIEVEVNYKIGEEMIKRRVAGGANFVCNSSQVPHTTASIRSLSVMSAVKVLGKAFGWGLNEVDEENANPKEQYADEEMTRKRIAAYIEAINEATKLVSVRLFEKTVERENVPALTEAYKLMLKKLSKQKPVLKKAPVLP